MKRQIHANLFYIKFCQNWLSSTLLIFLNTHLGYSLNFTVVYHCHVMGGIPPPCRGIVGKNRSTRSKTIVRRGCPLGSRGGPFTVSHSVNFLWFYMVLDLLSLIFVTYLLTYKPPKD